VGPSGANASHDAVRLVQAAAVSGRANGAHAKAVGYVTPTLGDFIVGLDGVSVGGRQFHTAQVVDRNGQQRREPIVQVRFAKLDLVGRVLHATTNPWLSYTLLVLGLLLIVFEFYSVGIGLAGLTGAICVALSAYGLAALGATPVGLVLIGVAVFGFAVDVQAGTARAWTLIGSAALLIGSWTLYPSDRRMAWWTILVVFALAFLFAVRGMTTMVRARFSTATIGRESMVGEAGEAATAINPKGTVRLRGALWPARVKQRKSIKAGAGVRVVAIDGLVLEVAPDEGGSERESSAGG
jgi:membrane-bound serine protease (ClpP class)